MKVQTNTAENQNVFVIKVDAKTAKIIDKDMRKKLVDAYLELFSGFSWINWTNNMSLGRAWQKSLGQCAAFGQTHNTKNPVAKYLKAVYEGHKKYWSRIIMTHPSNENNVRLDSEYVKKMRAHGEKMVKRAMDVINLIMAQYKSHTEMIEKSQNQVAKEQVASGNKVEPVAQPSARPVEMPTTGKTNQSVAKPANPSPIKTEIPSELAKLPELSTTGKTNQSTAKTANPTPIKTEIPSELAKLPELATTGKTNQSTAKPANPTPIKTEIPSEVAKSTEMKKREYVAPQIDVRKSDALRTGAEKVALADAKMRFQITRQINIFAINGAMQHRAA